MQPFVCIVRTIIYIATQTKTIMKNSTLQSDLKELVKSYSRKMKNKKESVDLKDHRFGMIQGAKHVLFLIDFVGYLGNEQLKNQIEKSIEMYNSENQNKNKYQKQGFISSLMYSLNSFEFHNFKIK